MSTEQELDRMIRSLEKRYRNECDRNREIQAQIDQLEVALGHAKQAELKAEALHSAIPKCSLPSRWVLAYKDPFKAALKGSLKTSSGDYERDIQQLREAIQHKIRDLRSEQNKAVLLLSSIEDSISNKKREKNSIAD